MMETILVLICATCVHVVPYNGKQTHNPIDNTVAIKKCHTDTKCLSSFLVGGFLVRKNRIYRIAEDFELSSRALTVSSRLLIDKYGAVLAYKSGEYTPEDGTVFYIVLPNDPVWSVYALKYARQFVHIKNPRNKIPLT